jgi:hypothetical protein
MEVHGGAVCRTVVADSHQFDEELYSVLVQSEKETSYLDLQQSEKLDTDPHHSDKDVTLTMDCMRVGQPNFPS